MRRKRVLAIFCGTLMAAAAASARQPGELPKPGFNLFSKQQDIDLGKEAAAQVQKQYQVVHNQFLEDYLKRVGERLASTPVVRESGFPFSFTLLNEKSVNAFALPGGPMFVFTGLFKAVDNEAQLAGVMAHEMSHVILRHGTNQVSKANLLQLPALLAGAVIGNGSMLGQLAQAGIGLGFNSVLLKFSRTDEMQADQMGARIMSDAGYNPIEMARFFEKLEKEGGSGGPEFLSDHPSTGNRVKYVEAEIQAFPQRSYDAATGQFGEAKRLIAQLPPPPKKSAAQGSAAAQEPAAATSPDGWQEYQGQHFHVSYPGAWQAWGAQDSGSVTLAPRDGLVQTGNGGTQVGLGAILSYFFPDEGRSNLRTETADLIHHLRTENPSMKVSGSARKVQVAGSDGLVTTLASSSPYGGGEIDILLTVSRSEGLFYLVFVCPERSYPTLKNSFQRMMNSLSFSR